MEPIENHYAILHDLALIYIALAHSTDEHLSDTEVNAIGERLRRWQNVKSATVLSALKQALDEYVKDGADKRVQEAVRNVRKSLPEDVRQHVLDDLMNIALADGRFLHKESSFIGDQSRAWNMHPHRNMGDEATDWNILTQDRVDGGWTLLHDVAIVYLTIAQGADGHLADEEIETIRRKINEWIPDAGEERVRLVLRDALTAYAQGPDERIFAESVEALSNAVPHHQRAALLSDLKSIAEADGTLLVREQQLIDQLARAWDAPMVS